jgi:putative membrane protein
MDNSDFGIWAMLAFWGSALGGIALAIGWAKSKGRNPASRTQLEHSLKRRLEKGEISQQEFDRRLAMLERDE